MENIIEEKIINRLIPCLPSGIAEEIQRHLKLRKGLTEIRLRRYGISELSFGTEKVGLSSLLSRSDMEEIVTRITDASLYAHKDSIERGFISLPFGVRVGVIGTARYDGGVLIGVSDVSSINVRVPSLPMRIPEVEKAFSETERGLLIYSPPGVGKTTALKALILGLSLGRERKNVAVIDERREFPPELFSSASLDVYFGYARAAGMEMALRTCAPDVLIIDEIAGENEAVLVSEFMLSGVKLAASIHAGCIDEVKRKPSLRPFREICAFDIALGIKREGSKYSYELGRLDD